MHRYDLVSAVCERLYKVDRGVDATAAERSVASATGRSHTLCLSSLLSISPTSYCIVFFQFDVFDAFLPEIKKRSGSKWDLSMFLIVPGSNLNIDVVVPRDIACCLIVCSS